MKTGLYKVIILGKFVSSKSAGLPNIFGGFGGGMRGVGAWNAFTPYADNSGKGYGWTVEGNTSSVDFNASRCSSVYGKSSTVTPLSMSTQFFIRH